MEQHNFQARKRTLEYDDVMNKQREIVYGFRNEIINGDDVRDRLMDIMEEVVQAKVEEFKDRFANPFVAAEHGFVDDVIEPRETRRHVIRALRLLETKVDTMPRKKHGNIPL